MTPRINVETLRARLRDQGLISFTQVTSLMMSGVFATAALVLLDILRTPDDQAVRLSFWMVGTVAEIVSLTAMMNWPLAAARPGYWTLSLTAIRGLCVIICFTMVAPASGGQDGWRYATLVNLAVSIASLLLAQSFNRLLDPELYEPDTRPMIQRLKALRGPGVRLAILFLPFSGLMFALAMGAKIYPWPLIPLIITLNLLGVAAFIAFAVADRQSFQDFEAAVEQAYEAKLKRDRGEAP